MKIFPTIEASLSLVFLMLKMMSIIIKLNMSKITKMIFAELKKGSGHRLHSWSPILMYLLFPSLGSRIQWWHRYPSYPSSQLIGYLFVFENPPRQASGLGQAYISSDSKVYLQWPSITENTFPPKQLAFSLQFLQVDEDYVKEYVPALHKLHWEPYSSSPSTHCLKLTLSSPINCSS